MGEPITWRNVTGPSVAEAARPLAFAQQAFSSGMDSLSGALKDYQTSQQDVWKKQDSEATQNLLSKLYRAQTPEALKALEASGELDATRAANGAVIDQSLINPVRDGRMAKVQDFQRQGWAFDRDKQNQIDSPIMGQARQALANKDYKTAQSFIAQLSPENAAAVSGEMLKQQLEITKHDADISRTNAEIKHWQTSDNNAAAMTKIEREKMDFMKREALEKRLSDVTTKIGEISASSITSSDGMKAAIDEVAKVVKDPKELAALTQKMGEVSSNPLYSGVSVSQLVRAALDSRKTSWYNNTIIGPDSGGGLAEKLDALVKSPEYSNYTARTEARGAVLAEQAAALHKMLYPGQAVPGAAPKPGATPEPAAAAPGATPTPAQPQAAQNPLTPPANRLWTPALQTEYATQLREKKEGLIRDFSPEVKAAIKEDDNIRKSFNERLDSERVRISKEQGWTIPPKPGTFMQNTSGIMMGSMDPMATLAMAQAEQEKYNNWVKLADARLAQEREKGKAK